MKRKVMNPLPIILKVVLAISALTAVLTTFLFNGNTINFTQAATLITICAIGVIVNIVALIQTEG